MYRGNGAGGWATGLGQQVGAGWGGFTALIAPGDFSGDGKPDVLGRASDGRLLLYRGDGDGGWLNNSGEPVGVGWQPFPAVIAGGDFSGDGRGRPGGGSDGQLLLYRGDGRGGWVTGRGEPVGVGWARLHGARVGRRLQRRRQARHPRRTSGGELLQYRGTGRAAS